MIENRGLTHQSQLRIAIRELHMAIRRVGVALGHINLCKNLAMEKIEDEMDIVRFPTNYLEDLSITYNDLGALMRMLIIQRNMLARHRDKIPASVIENYMRKNLGDFIDSRGEINLKLLADDACNYLVDYVFDGLNANTPNRYKQIASFVFTEQFGENQ